MTGKKRKVKTKKLNQKGGEEIEGTVKTPAQEKREQRERKNVRKWHKKNRRL
jgi:hypothetical protein